MKIMTLSLLSALRIGIWFTLVSGSCSCNDYVNDPYPLPSNSSNVVAKLTSVLLRLLPGSPGVPQRLAIVTAAIFDMYALSSTLSFPSVSGVCSALIHPNADGDTVDDTAVYAAYAAMRLVFQNDPEKLIQLSGYMTSLGYDSRVVDGHVGSVIARAVATKFKLPMPPTPYQAPNAASKSFDAMCESITDPDGRQAQCVQSTVGNKCEPQKVPFLALFNASLITTISPVSQLVAKLAPPPTFDDSLSTLPVTMGINDFADQYLLTLAASESLDDSGKIVAEFFAPNIALRLFNRALDEVNQRNLSSAETATLFFAMSAAMRDALVASVTVKLTLSTIRPISVIQCAYSEQNITAWNAPYRGVRSLKKEDGAWRSYLQTPPFPGYTSGNSAVAAAGAQVLGHFFKGERPLGANCHMTKAGISVIEPRIEKGSPGYERGVTDVPNRGARSEGFSPAKDVTVCWNSWQLPADNEVGATLGTAIGDQAYVFVTRSWL